MLKFCPVAPAVDESAMGTSIDPVNLEERSFGGGLAEKAWGVVGGVSTGELSCSCFTRSASARFMMSLFEGASEAGCEQRAFVVMWTQSGTDLHVTTRSRGNSWFCEIGEQKQILNQLS